MNYNKMNLRRDLIIICAIMYNKEVEEVKKETVLKFNILKAMNNST
jgi:hypothetical protein